MATIYANIILTFFKKEINAENLKLLECMANARCSYKKRIQLFFYPGPRQCKLYEFIWAKIKIFFGWL